MDVIEKHVLIYDLVNFAFDESDKRPFRSSNSPLPFVHKWKIAVNSVIGQMNDALRMKKDTSIRHRQHIQTFTTDILTVSSIKKKMVTLIEGLGLKLLPVLAKTTFWGSVQEGMVELKFCHARTKEVENVTVITMTKQGVPIRINSKEKSRLDMETKIRVSVYTKLIYIYTQNNKKYIHYFIYQVLDEVLSKEFPNAAAELRTHCVFHLTKCAQNLFMPYKNIRRSHVLATGLFVSIAKRDPIIPAPDAIWLAKYKELFGSK